MCSHDLCLHEEGDRYAQRSRNGDKIVETNLTCSPFDVRNMDLMRTRVLCEVNLPLSLFLPELSDPFPEPGGVRRFHSFSIEFAYTLNFVYTLNLVYRLFDRIL
jgi:hypothetical protein